MLLDLKTYCQFYSHKRKTVLLVQSDAGLERKKLSKGVCVRVIAFLPMAPRATARRVYVFSPWKAPGQFGGGDENRSSKLSDLDKRKVLVKYPQCFYQQTQSGTYNFGQHVSILLQSGPIQGYSKKKFKLNFIDLWT